MQRSPESFTEIIDALGGGYALGGRMGLPTGTTSAMRTRDSIAPGYWPQVIQIAEAVGLAGVTYETLARLYAARRKRPAPRQTEAA